MKKPCLMLAAVGFLGILACGCQDVDRDIDAKRPVASTNTDIADYSVASGYSLFGVNVDRKANHMKISVRDVLKENSLDAMTLVISRSESIDGWGIGSTTLTNTNGALLWEFRISWPLNLDSTVVITERTASDSLTIVRSISGGLITEQYIQNDGETAEFTFTEEIVSELRDPNISKESTDLMIQSEKLKQDFISFYRSNTSLSNNQYGKIVANILSDDGALAWIQAHAERTKAGRENGNLLKTQDPQKLICGIASVCGTLKCSLPPWLANPLCVPCTGVALACAIADIISWFSD